MYDTIKTTALENFIVLQTTSVWLHFNVGTEMVILQEDIL